MTKKTLSSYFVIGTDNFPENDQFAGYFFDGYDLFQGVEGASVYREKHGV